MRAAKFRRVVFYGTMVLFILTLLSLIQQPVALAAEKEPIKLGFVGGMTGMFYLTAKPCLDGVNMAVKEVNAAGGILGREVELYMRDDENKVDVSVRETKDLILRKKVDVILSCSNSGITIAQSELAKQYKIPMFALAGNSHRVTEEKGHRYVFQLSPNTRMEGSTVATFISKQGYKTVWTVAADYEWGHTFTDFTLNKLKQLSPGIKVIGQSWPKLGETDFTPYITTILAAKPDFVMGGLFGADGMNFTKQAKGYGYFEKLKASNVYEFNLLRALGNEMVEGAIGFSRGEFFCVNTPEMKAFVEKFRKAYGGEYPTFHSVTGRDAIYCTMQAMEKTKGTNKEKVTEALIGMEFIGPRGKLYFRKCDNQINGTNYVGFTTKTPEYPFYVYKDILAVPGEETWASCEEVMKLRGQK